MSSSSYAFYAQAVFLSEFLLSGENRHFKFILSQIANLNPE